MYKVCSGIYFQQTVFYNGIYIYIVEELMYEWVDGWINKWKDEIGR